MNIGDRAQVQRVFDRQVLAEFAALTGSKASPPDRVPEPLIAGLFSYLLGAELPGFGTNYMKQALHFHATAEVGESLTASVTITRLRPDKALVDLSTRCSGTGDRLICEGRALVLVKDVGRANPINPGNNGDQQCRTTEARGG